MTTKIQPTRTPIISTSLRALIATTCMLLAAPFAQADDAQYFTEVAPGVVKDSRTGLEWMRCSLGQEWSVEANTCKGKIKEFNWQGAQDIAKKLNAMGGYAQRTDWRVPSNRELASIRYCSTGFKEFLFKYRTIDLHDSKPVVPSSCADNSTRPTIAQSVFPATSASSYWSSTPTAGKSSVAWGVDFYDDGYFGNYGRYHDIAVRLVR